MFAQPVFQTIEDGIARRKPAWAAHIPKLRIIWRSLYVVVTALFAILIPFFQALMGLVGTRPCCLTCHLCDTYVLVAGSAMKQHETSGLAMLLDVALPECAVLAADVRQCEVCAAYCTGRLKPLWAISMGRCPPKC